MEAEEREAARDKEMLRKLKEARRLLPFAVVTLACACALGLIVNGYQTSVPAWKRKR